jgi:glucose-1-phosphate adenylyltransferase
MNRVLAVVLAGGEGKRLSVLAHERAKPAVPFAGKYRIIDFTLSNCVNSGINSVAVIPQYNPRSLALHIGVGKPWDLDRVVGGVTMLYPFVGYDGEMHWYQGTAEAADHVYTMHYEQMLKLHRQQKADITVGVTEVPWNESNRFGILALDDSSTVTAFEEKPSQPKNNLASMGIYVFNKDMISEILEDAHRRGLQDFGSQIIPDAIGKYRIYGYKYQGYWRDVGTIEAYWQANMDLVVALPEFNLYDPETPVKTLSVEMPPVKVGPRAQITRSLVSNGCIVDGKVSNSVLSPHVYVEEGAHVMDSVVFHDTVVAQGAVVQRSIIDKECCIGSGCWIGCGEDYTPNKDEPDNLVSGITVIGKGARLPPGLRVGRNCKIDPGVRESDFSTLSIPSGTSVVAKKPLQP